VIFFSYLGAVGMFYQLLLPKKVALSALRCRQSLEQAIEVLVACGVGGMTASLGRGQAAQT
jgi:hypothetical protein